MKGYLITSLSGRWVGTLDASTEEKSHGRAKISLAAIERSLCGRVNFASFARRVDGNVLSMITVNLSCRL